jgi:hypothetical protein
MNEYYDMFPVRSNLSKHRVPPFIRNRALIEYPTVLYRKDAIFGLEPS